MDTVIHALYSVAQIVISKQKIKLTTHQTKFLRFATANFHDAPYQQYSWTYSSTIILNRDFCCLGSDLLHTIILTDSTLERLQKRSYKSTALHLKKEQL